MYNDGVSKIDVLSTLYTLRCHGSLARHVKLRVAHAPGTFYPPLWVSDPDMYHGTCVTHVPWYMPGSLTISFLWRRWRGKRSWHSRRMRNPQLYLYGKRSIIKLLISPQSFLWVQSVIKLCPITAYNMTLYWPALQRHLTAFFTLFSKWQTQASLNILEMRYRVLPVLCPCSSSTGTD